MTDMILLNDLTKTFGSLKAVDGISLKVKRGEVLGFLGPNGAGKSTTMKMAAGFLTPTSGTAVICGHDVMDQPVEVKRAIGYLPEGAPTYGDMTAAALLDFVADIRALDPASRKRRIGEAVERLELGDVLGQTIETLSKGYKRRVGLAQAILHDPEVLILDEPTDGLDPNQKHHVRSLIHDMARDKAVIISTHILEEVEAVCTRAVIIDHGRLLADGTPQDLLARSRLHNAVRIRLDGGKATALKDQLMNLPGVADVEMAADADGLVHLTVLPQDGGSITMPVGDFIREQQVPVSEMYVEQGSLDEVFRDVTLGQAQGGQSDA